VIVQGPKIKNYKMRMFCRLFIERKNIDKRLSVFFLLLSVIMSCCKKLVQVPSPTTSLTSNTVYSDDATAAAVLTGIYTEIALPTPTSTISINSIALDAGLSGDELILYGGSGNFNKKLVQYYFNELASGSSITRESSIWSNLYSVIYVVNIALERLSISNTLTSSVKQQLLGEAKFLRGFF